MIRPIRQTAPTVRTPCHIELHTGDVAAMKVIEDGDIVRLAVYDHEHRTIPLIAVELSRDERRQLISALAGVDLARAPHG